MTEVSIVKFYWKRYGFLNLWMTLLLAYGTYVVIRGEAAFWYFYMCLGMFVVTLVISNYGARTLHPMMLRRQKYLDEELVLTDPNKKVP